MTWRWRLVGKSHPYAAEVIPVGDVIIHWRGPDCPCSPAVSFERHEDEPDGQNVTETWLHREVATD